MEDSREEAAQARLADRELLRQFQEIEQLPEDDKLTVRKVIEAFLVKHHVQQIATR